MMSKIAHRRGGEEDIRTFSVGFGYEALDELKYARAVSEYFGTYHKEFLITSEAVQLLPKIIWHLDEPMGDPALIPVYILSENAKKNITVILTGDGGDEILAGYEHYKFLTLGKKFENIPKTLRKEVSSFLIKKLPKFVLDKIFKYSSSIGEKGMERAINVISSIEDPIKAYAEFVSLFNDEERKELYSNETLERIKEFSFYQSTCSKYFKHLNRRPLDRLQYLEIKTTLPENFLMKNDKMTMTNSVEARVPFLDHRLVEFSFTLPPKLKLNGFNEKYILKKAMQPYLPKDIIMRKKQRFYVPIDLWLMGELRPMVDDLVSAKNIKRQGYFNFDYIEKLFKNYDRSRLFYGRQLWNILTFEIWHKIYIEGKDWKKIAV
jgi:asparagine synthase (glutamine-hydrolysing)